MSIACVVKLGGSQAFAPALRPWLGAIAAAAGEVAIVPGGGPFADAVRDAQPDMEFDDAAAHAMSLHAMTQFGVALTSLGRTFGFVMAKTPDQIARALANKNIPVWSPLAMLRDAPEVPKSWSVTSDSLALWFATKLEAPCLLLVKAVRAPDGATVPMLVADGLVDRAFPDFLARYTGALFLAGPEDVPPAGLDARHPPGLPLRAVA